MQIPSQPVIVLSARCEEFDKVLLLELGADDYVTKPFSPRELLARAHTVMRRSHEHIAPERYAFDEVSIDFVKMEATRAGNSVLFTANEFRLVKHFCQNPGRVISRDELLSQIRQSSHSNRTVDDHIMRLRRKLERDPARPVHFITVHCVGYQFLS